MFDRINFGRLLPTTYKIFHSDVELNEVTATVLFVRDEFVVLDRTIFYTECGGQAPDRGTIGGVEVVDVQALTCMRFEIADRWLQCR